MLLQDPPATPIQAEPIRDHFCTRRGPTCRRPGVFVRVEVTRDARVGGVLRRVSPRSGRLVFWGTITYRAPKGRSLLRFTRTASRRHVSPGRYQLRLSTGDGISGRPAVVRFLVRPS